ncbi:MAG: hypothetical protein J1F07_09750 [Muribaculaceae bacterium]|nr:hypothetical protein [Muribaculaceae bacterium]
MKKILLLAAAALFASSSAFAIDYYIAGGNINGAENWGDNNADNKFAAQSDGTYKWSGTELGSGFKVRGSSWDEYDKGSNGETLEVGKAYVMGDGGNIMLPSGTKLTNPTVVFNASTNTITVTGTSVEIGLELYVMGASVNGVESWGASAANKMENIGGGVFEWKGETLGTSFKIADASWSEYNYGTTGAALALNTPYYPVYNGSNIAFDGFSVVNNPVVTFDTNTKELVVAGEAEGTYEWFIPGFNGTANDALDATTKMTQVGETNVYIREEMVVVTAGEFKISATGWALQFGKAEGEEIFIDPENLSTILSPVGMDGTVEYELTEGMWTAKWDIDEQTITFVSGADGVEKVVLGKDAKAVYYNLQGQKVANPDKGIYIKVADCKAVKVVK